MYGIEILEKTPDVSEIKNTNGKLELDIFTNEKELVSIVNIEVEEIALNITLNKLLICSLITQWKDETGKNNIKYLRNTKLPTFSEEEISSKKSISQKITLVCYRSDISFGRLLESTNKKVKVTFEYITGPIKEENESVKTVVTTNEKEQVPTSKGTNVSYVFLGGLIFLIIIVLIVFFVRKWNNTLTSSENHFKKSEISETNKNESLHILTEKRIEQNPYQNFDRK